MKKGFVHYKTTYILYSVKHLVLHCCLCVGLDVSVCEFVTRKTYGVFRRDKYVLLYL